MSNQPQEQTLPSTAGRRTQRCKSCNKEIFFMKTSSGQIMPLDALPSPDGHIDISTGIAVPLNVKSHKGQGELFVAEGSGVPLYTSHFATCLHAARHRSVKE